MKVVLQHIKSSLYFQGRGNWTSDLAEAFNFERSKQAMDYAKQNGISGVQVIVAIPEPHRVETMPFYFPSASSVGGPEALRD